jgi:hypothetical protein
LFYVLFKLNSCVYNLIFNLDRKKIKIFNINLLTTEFHGVSLNVTEFCIGKFSVNE